MPKILAYPIVDATRILPSNFDKENEKVYKRKLQHDFTIKGQNKKQRTVEVQLKQKTLFIKKVTDGVPFKLVATHPALEPAHDAMVATDNLLKYGCSALDCKLRDKTLDAVLHSCARYKPTKSKMRGTQGLRWSMNDDRHMHDRAWRDLLSELLGNDMFVAAMTNWVRSIDQFGRWFFDIFGGDTVLPGDCGQELHSDWWGRIMHIIAVSIAVSDPIEDAAPMRIIPGLAPMEKSADMADIPPDSLCHTVLIPKGSVFLRDVNVWHSGTANTTGFTRILPCIRFVTVRERLPVLYSSLENSLWIEYFGKSIRAVKAVMKKKWTPDASPYEKTCTKALSLCRSMHFLDLTLIVQLWNVSKCFHVQIW